MKVLVTRLQLAGYQVYSATNGEEALESFHRDSPDLIVLDVMLPKMDGFAVCRRIRAESVVPIIFLIVRIYFQCNSCLLWSSENSFLTMSKARILVVDDEPAVLKVLVTRLQLAGYQVFSATNGEEALESFHRDSPDLIVLDVMLPKMDGFAVCRRIRAESVVPIIFLTALEAISERVAGLDLGADDYLSKPFSPKELEARIATILRRMGPTVSVTETKEVPSGKGVMKFGSLVVDTNRRQVSRAGERISLTYTEFSLLELLFDEPGKVVPRAEILEQLWGYPPRRAADLRVVDVYVARLRGKLEPDPRNPELILTVRGIGYASQRVGETATSLASWSLFW